MSRCNCQVAVLLASTVAACLLAFCLYDAPHESVQDRALIAARCAVLKFLTTLGRLLEVVKLGSFETMVHRFTGLVFPTPSNNSFAAYYYRQFDGIQTLVVEPAQSDRPTGVRSSAAVIYIHGGGWAFGAPEMYSQIFAEIVNKTGVTLFGLRYRLSPVQSYPAAFDDCLSATLAIFAEAGSLGLDAGRIALAGDSAGGQLTASVAQQLRRVGSPHRPKLQLIVYPVTQVLNLRTDSYLSQSSVGLMKPLRMKRFVSLYLTGNLQASEWIGLNGHATEAAQVAYEKATGQRLTVSPDDRKASADISESEASRVVALSTDFRVSPLLGADLEKLDLPPAHILACEFDPLRDDAILYADRLRRAGVRTHLYRFRTYHGAIDMPSDGKEIRDCIAQVIFDSL